MSGTVSDTINCTETSSRVRQEQYSSTAWMAGAAAAAAQLRKIKEQCTGCPKVDDKFFYIILYIKSIPFILLVTAKEYVFLQYLNI